MKKIAFAGAALLVLGLLTGCAVSQEEKDACAAAGGEVMSEKFVYSSGGFFGDSKTGNLNYCKQSGQIFTVYNERVTELKTGFFATNENNARVFNECTAREGDTYRTSYRVGKTTYTRYACISGGEYVQILG